MFQPVINKSMGKVKIILPTAAAGWFGQDITNVDHTPNQKPNSQKNAAICKRGVHPSSLPVDT
jgi:hypothetical protein